MVRCVFDWPPPHPPVETVDRRPHVVCHGAFHDSGRSRYAGCRYSLQCAGIKHAEDQDPLQKLQPAGFLVLHRKFFIDEFYETTVVRLTSMVAVFSGWLDRYFWGGAVWLLAQVALLLSWLNRLLDDLLVNAGFNKGCGSFQVSGRMLSHFENGQVQRYLRIIALALLVFMLIFIWGCT